MVFEYRIPRDLYYSEDHTWILVEENEGLVGVSDYAQSELSEVVYVDLPDVGTEVVQGAPFGSIEAMKTVAELICPVTGEVVEVNEIVEDVDPRQINMDPYGDGWMIKVALYDDEEVESLLTPQEYLVFVTGDEDI